LPPRLKRQTDAEGHSPASEPWRAWYGTARWKRLRMETFKRDLFTCQMVDCGKLIANPAQLVADHKVRHRGDPGLFWAPDNLQTLCTHCHNATKQAEERRFGG
jgi:5-methylcytosine-specific restriction endonuclease McrA